MWRKEHAQKSLSFEGLNLDSPTEVPEYHKYEISGEEVTFEQFEDHFGVTDKVIEDEDNEIMNTLQEVTFSNGNVKQMTMKEIQEMIRND